MFPTKINQRKTSYHVIESTLPEVELKELLIKQPYEIYAVINESLDKDNPLLTTFLVLYSVDFQENVVFYDLTREPHTTVTTELFYLSKGYVEYIDVGIVERYPVKLYKKEKSNENI